jgi:DNA-binding CsgD family transcriptional regulator
MSVTRQLILVTQDQGLLAHWQSTFGKRNARQANSLAEISKRQRDVPVTIWVDESTLGLTHWHDVPWQNLFALEHVRVVAASSNPNEEKAIQALDAGCAGYCHAFATSSTLKQVQQVIDAGQVWIGKNLMQRLLHGTSRLAGKQDNAASTSDWSQTLTEREREVAVLAANGASNLVIAADCGITERTVKAHLSAVFVKLNITDRLQLALRVHGIN